MPVILFHRRFHDAILSGAKRQTIRAPRKWPVKLGDAMLLRAWEGAAYRSKQRHLLSAVCTSFEPVRLELSPGAAEVWVELAGIRLSPRRHWKFFEADGFASPQDFRDYWYATLKHLGPFEGTVIRWEAAP